jgi:hypothetical protein
MSEGGTVTLTYGGRTTCWELLGEVERPKVEWWHLRPEDVRPVEDGPLEIHSKRMQEQPSNNRRSTLNSLSSLLANSLCDNSSMKVLNATIA